MSVFKSRRFAALLVSLSPLAAPQLVQASHFRGGSITWQALDLDGDGVKNDVRITVTSVLQTSAGKMIFGRMPHEAPTKAS